MSDHSSMSPPPPPPEGYGAHPRGEKPGSISTALNIIWALVALSVLNAVLTFLFLDDMIEATLDSARAAGAPVSESTARSGIILGLAIGLLIGVGLYVILAVFLAKGHNWARIVLTILAGLGIVGGLFGLLGGGGGTPATTLVLQVLSVLLAVALVFFLWKKESSAWLTGRG